LTVVVVTKIHYEINNKSKVN